MVSANVDHVKPERVVQNTLLDLYFSKVLFGPGSEREAEFRVITTQSPVQHESFSNSTPK